MQLIQRMCVVLLCIGFLVACGGEATAPSQGTDDTAQPAKQTFRIAFSQCNSAEPYRATQNKILLEAIKKYPDCTLDISDAQQDNARQISQIENIMLTGANLLIVAPNEAAPLTSIVREAHEGGMKVICLERDLAEPVYDLFVGADNRTIGEMAGQFIKAHVESSGIQNPVVVEMKGLLGSPPQEERHDGARKYIDQLEGVDVIEEVADWIQDKGKVRMETVLQANPKIDVVYAHNDPMAVGCYLAAKDAGRDGEMIFVGVDGLGGAAGGIKKVIDSVLDCTFIYPTCAAEALDIAVKILHGDPVPSEPVILEPTRITKENAQEWYDKTTLE